MLSLIAQSEAVTPEIEVMANELFEQLFGQWMPILAIAMPLVLAVVTQYMAEEKAKKYMAGLGAVILAAASMASMDWTAITFAILPMRIMTAWGIAEVGYRIFDKILNTVTPASIDGLNGLGNIISGGFGVGTKDPKKLATAA